ncbi:hypothetical protein [Pseudomonas leptonychotis]|nr:hypothetical protein [Pseudomonas leptonychotis]
MKITATQTRSLLLVCLFGLLSACGADEPETQSEVESHGHAHD